MNKLFCLLGLLLLSCTPFEKSNDNTVSVSILPLKYLVDSISGGDFSVNVIVPPGASPETFEPTPSQMKQIALSKVYFQLGLIDFEKSLSESINENMPEVMNIKLSEGLELIEGSCGHNHGHGIDPHIWMSPKYMITMAQRVAEVLSKVNADSATKYSVNLNKLIDNIRIVSDGISVDLGVGAQKTFVIFHPVLTYYAKDFGLKQVSVESDGKEPSTNRIKGLIKTIKNENIKSILYQKQLSTATIEAISNETGVKAIAIDPLAYDWSESIMQITKALK